MGLYIFYLCGCHEGKPTICLVVGLPDIRTVSKQEPDSVTSPTEGIV